jgi:26S proteasome regulatory subunit N5
MSDGALKPEKDFSKEADKQIPEAETLAKVPFKLLDATESL